MATPESTRPIGNALIIWTTLPLLWSSFFVGVRTWAKWQQQWFYADGVFVAGYVAVLAQGTTIYLALTRLHLGSTPEDYVVNEYESWMEMLYASQILYILSMGLSKCSTTLFLHKLSQSKKHKVASTILVALSTAWTVGSWFSIALRENLSAPWEDVEAPYLRWVVVETIGLSIELLLWTFAFALVWGLNTRLQRRVKLLAIFAARLILIPIVVIRLIQLSPSAYHRTIRDIVETNILAQMIMHWALTSECLTCLKPFLQTWHDGVPTDSNTPQYWGALSNLTNSHSAHQSGAGKSNSRVGTLGRTQQTDREGREGALKLRSDDSGFSTKIASQRRGSSAAWTAETDDDIELLPTSSIRVRMTTTMTSS